jgi:hypothetical protein
MLAQPPTPRMDPPANPDALMVDALEAVKETKIWHFTHMPHLSSRGAA